MFYVIASCGIIDRSSSSKIKRKSTPRKRKVNNRKRVSESNVNADMSDMDSRGDSDLSSVRPPSGSDVDDADSGTHLYIFFQKKS